MTAFINSLQAGASGDRLTHLVAVPTGARLLGLGEFVMLVVAGCYIY